MEIHWRPTIGDPTAMGWLTVFAYLATAVACYAASLKQPGRLWRWLPVVFLFLAFNKQIDLQSLFTEVGKISTRQMGLYGHRGSIQATMIVIILAVAGIGIVTLLVALKRPWSPKSLALTGLIVLTSFIAIRALSFHHFDRFIGTWYGPMKGNWILELSAISMVLAAALWERGRSRH
jgi:hypothetical protein